MTRIEFYVEYRYRTALRYTGRQAWQNNGQKTVKELGRFVYAEDADSALLEATSHVPELIEARVAQVNA